MSRLNKTNVEVEKRMSRLNKTNLKVEKRRPFVNTSDKLNFDKENAPYHVQHDYFSTLDQSNS